MIGFLRTHERTTLRHDWDVGNITTTFFKCTRWQEEEFMDLTSSCRYRYSCDNTYPGDYPPIIDYLVFFFTAACYLLTLFFTVKHARGGIEVRESRRRCLLPSGPILMPFILLILSNGQRINTIFPLSRMGPVLLQLVHVSTLAFENPADISVKYALLESSTASGILHASLYLDSIILPYYTGMDALARSTFSGECTTCLCREEALVVGGTLVSYRGWSVTVFSIVGTLCSRMACGLFRKDKLSTWIKFATEGVGWILISCDCVYLMVGFPQKGFPEMAANGAVCVLIALHILRKISNILGFFGIFFQPQKKRETVHSVV